MLKPSYKFENYDKELVRLQKNKKLYYDREVHNLDNLKINDKAVI